MSILRKWWFWVIVVFGLITCATLGTFLLVVYGRYLKAPLAVEVPAEATNLGDTQALADFWETYDSYIVAADREWTIWQEHNQNLDGIDEKAREIVGLTVGQSGTLRKLGQEGLDIVAEQQEILDRVRQAVYEQSPIVSQLHGNVTRIADPTKKSLAQGIVDKLRELNNLRLEELALRDKDTRYWKEDLKNTVFVSQGKWSMDEANQRREELNKPWEEIDSKLREVWNARDALYGEVSDLVEKLKNL